MTRTISALSCLFAMLGAAPVLAEPPGVVADIAPVHSLVAAVMDGVGTPDLILNSDASAHDYSLRPSEAATLSAAEVVFWIGPELSPWLQDGLATLAPEARTVALLAHTDTVSLSSRDAALFGGDNHDHDDPTGKETHGHEHGGIDPHAWLDPANAIVWLSAIAKVLGEEDPENATAYFANADAKSREIADLSATIAKDLAGLSGMGFLVFHDSYQYFERRFGIQAAGAITLSDASDPSPSRLSDLRDHATGAELKCILTEPAYNRGLIDSITAGKQISVAIVDPMGADLAPGPDQYTRLLGGISAALVDCLR